MFARTFPRVVSRTVSRAAQCEANPQVHVFSKLPARMWKPIQRPCRRQEKTTFLRGFKEEYRKNPFLFSLAVGGILAVSAIGVFYIPYYYTNYIIKPFHNYPESVAKKLRKAIFYSSGSNMDIREANKWYRLALQEADELGMDPFSDEILGIKIAISAVFEHAGQYKLATDVLEIIRTDCFRWLEELGNKHWNDGKRTRVLQRTIEFNVKLGELYTLKYMNEPEYAERRLTEAVETMLKEKQRREKEGVKPGEGDWMSDEEIGATLEALAQHYEKNDAHYLATPLFLQALTVCPPTSCHGVVLMNNISTCLAQQQAPPPSLTSSKTLYATADPPPRSVLIDQGRQWATKALAKAAMIKPPDRNEECDLGCATATHNLGEFFEMEGKIQEARQKYTEAKSLAKAISFKEGLVNARAGLTRLRMLEKQS
jgi:tetratricopeptide (TPR) repeat protein